MKTMTASFAAITVAATLFASGCGSSQNLACGVLEADGDDYVQVDPSACNTPGNAPWGPMYVSPSEIDTDDDGGYGIYAGKRYDSKKYDKNLSRKASPSVQPAARPAVRPATTPQAAQKPRSSWFSSASPSSKSPTASSGSSGYKAPTSSSSSSSSSPGSKSSSGRK